MNQQGVFSSAQIITQHPILMASPELRFQYYGYLRKLIRLIKWDRRKYPKAQLSFYENILCGESVSQDKFEEWGAIRPYYYLLPFDVVAILAYRKNAVRPDVLSKLIDQITSDFKLPDKATDILRVGFSAAFGNEQAWNNLSQNRNLKQHKEYLDLVRDNISFINDRPYNILITATMSAGKSTLINAFAGKNISLMQNMAATSKIHTVISKPFDDGVTTEYDSEISLDASKDELLTDNEDNRTTRIIVSTYFYGPIGGKRVIFYDSPGVTSSENSEHTEITSKMLKSKKYKLLLYVINATQLATTDEEEHLRFVANLIGRRKVLFVLNKIDHLISEDESLPDVIARQKDFLKQHGFKAPVICPVSAYAAYLTKKSRHEQLSQIEQFEIVNYINKFKRSSLSEYYEKELGYSKIPVTGNEVDDLYRNCGFAYLENIIGHYKEEE